MADALMGMQRILKSPKAVVGARGGVQPYEMLRGGGKVLEGEGLRDLVQECFGQARVEDGRVTASYGALGRLTTWNDGKNFSVDTEMKEGVGSDIAQDTIQASNHFLERATGCTTKERAKRAQEKAKKSAA